MSKSSEAVVVLAGNDHELVQEAAKNIGTQEIYLNLTANGPWFGTIILNPRPSASVASEAIRSDYGLTAVACSTLREGRERLWQIQETPVRG